MSMEPIYATGHREPDADPIVAANGYVSLRNTLSDFEYEAACIGCGAAVTVGRTWKQRQERKGVHAIPVSNDDRTLLGVMSREDIADYNMELNNACVLDKILLSNVRSLLEG